MVGLLIGAFLSVLGRSDEGSEVLGRARAVVDELGHPWMSLMAAGDEADNLRTAGRVGEAEARFRANVQGWKDLGVPSNAAMAAGYWVRTLCDLERFEEALEAATETISMAGPWDVEAIVRIEAGRARALAHLGRIDEALDVVRGAEERVRPTGLVELLAEVLLSRADVYHLAGRSEEAVAAARESLEIYERKEFVTQVERARTVLATVSG